MANAAQAQGEVTVGGVVEVMGGTSDHDKGADGLDRGLFSRINVDYSNTLENGLEIGASLNHIIHQSAAYPPDVMSVSVGGGFGTVSVGQHALATCATMPRPIALAAGGVNATWHGAFMGTTTGNITHSEFGYCDAATAVSFATPTMGGFSAMVSYAPNRAANQTRGVAAARKNAANVEDYVGIAGKFSTDMGGMSLNLGASMETGADDKIDSVSVAGTVGFSGLTLGASWFDNGDLVMTAAAKEAMPALYGTDADGNKVMVAKAAKAEPAGYLSRSGYEGWTIGANYALGAIKPAITYSQQERAELMREETVLVVGASYALGGGATVFAEYFGIETEEAGVSDDETILMSGIIVSF